MVAITRTHRNKSNGTTVEFGFSRIGPVLFISISRIATK